MYKKIICLLAISSALANSNELDQLIEHSSTIVDQMNKGVLMVGAGLEYAHQGTGLSDGTMHLEAQITTEQLTAYNSALINMSNYLPYGDTRQTLLDKAEEHLQLVDESVDVFTGAVLQMQTAHQVVEMAETAATPNEEEQVKDFVTANVESLQITQETVDDFNSSAASIEENANIASSFIAVANNTEATEFLRQGAEDNNTTVNMSSVAYDANQQWVKMTYGNGNANAVYLNGQSFGLDLYLTTTEILQAGNESDFYQTSPMLDGYSCYFEQDC
nr:hypothetical protein [uncultured Mediterranean phage uvMED]